MINTYRYSSLHARVVGLVSQIINKNYTLGMENLYMSANVFHITLDIPQRVQAHGVTRSGKIGIPDIIKQE